MKTVHKYPFPITDRFTLDLPDEAKILTAFIQDPTPPRRIGCLWAEVDTDMRRINVRNFSVVGTGNPIPKGAIGWIATFQDVPFIWHLYEVNHG